MVYFFVGHETTSIWSVTKCMQIAGLILLAFSAVINDSDYLEKLITFVPGPSNLKNILDPKELAEGCSYFFAVVGVVLFGIGVLGCCFICFKKKWMLILVGWDAVLSYSLRTFSYYCSYILNCCILNVHPLTSTVAISVQLHILMIGNLSHACYIDIYWLTFVYVSELCLNFLFLLDHCYLLFLS